MSCVNCYSIFSISEIQPAYIFIGLKEGYKWLKFIYIWKGTNWNEKSPLYADMVNSRVFSSIKMTLYPKSIFIIVVHLWVSFPMQLESSNLEVCRANYGQNTKTVQSEELCPFRLDTIVPTRQHRADSARVASVTSWHTVLTQHRPKKCIL